MNRRDFLGAFLSGLIAALVLPFEDFARWLKWCVSSPEKFKAQARITLETFDAMLKRAYAGSIQRSLESESPFFAMLRGGA